ncbi:universal stress protein [Maribacter forsetii]|uniref:universal stress protein n=1 Tax=Maribacter forsetii TaxID=444515 RepID=UPI00055B885F|nr:universal stress protein [Maribacter forsetii]
MKNILIPTDFSSAAWNATEFALHLFAEVECKFYFLNAYTPEIYSNRLMAGGPIGKTKQCTAQKTSEKGLHNLVARIKKSYKNELHQYKKISTFSLLIEEVKELILKHKIDFIIMGATGSAEDDALFMGRNAVRLLNTIDNCAVLTIPKNYKFRNLTSVAFISDANYLYNGNELYPLINLCSVFKSTVHIININEVPGYMTTLQKLNLETIDHKLENVPHHFYDVTIETSLAMALGTFIDQTNCQLLVVSNNTNGFMKNLRVNFIVERSVFNTEVPILSLQAKQNHIAISR